ncbi:MAG: hypothetical protein CMJ83_20115 [Planctomycetes bacterium]|nr:hypothetical protein [Planctomycetota bacterium]
MDDTANVKALRKRVAQIVRRVESHPERGALILKGDVSDLLTEMKRLARSEPSTVLDVLLFLMERLSPVMGELDDNAGFAGGLIPEIVGRIRGIMRQDARTGDQQIDHANAVDRLFKLWVEDAEGYYTELDGLLLSASETPAGELTLRDRLVTYIRGLPLVFPPPRGASDDLRRALSIAERHRCERLLGELLARIGMAEYAVIVAEDHYRRTGDALDLVASLHRDGRAQEAIIAARKALASPRSFQRQRIQEFLDTLLADTIPDTDRETRKELERIFIADPSAKSFKALKKAVPDEQWSRVRNRVLGHLQKHQKAPTLLFRLYIEEGDLMEADGLVVVQPIDADVLVEGAHAVMEWNPSMAAGWMLFAAHHRVATRRASAYPKIVRDLLLVRELADSGDQRPAFRKALTKFRSRYARRRKLIEALDAAGLVPG